MEEVKRKKYYDLRYRLSHHVLKGNDDHQRLMSTAGAKGLTAVEQHPPDFTNICDVFDRKGLLGPDKLDVLKEIFPSDKNDKAYDDIVKTEKEISELIQGSSDGNRQSGTSGSDQFAKGYTVPVTVKATNVQPPTGSKADIYRAIQRSLEICINDLNKSEVGPNQRAREIKEITSNHLESFQNVREFLDYCEQNGFTLSNTDTGSLRLFFRFYSKKGIDRIQYLYRSGKLQSNLQSGLITEELLKECNIQAVELTVEILEEDIKKCFEQMGYGPDADTRISNTTDTETTKSLKLDTREIGKRKTKETFDEMIKPESIMPVKQKKMKLTTGKNGEQSRKDDTQIPKKTPRSLHVAAKKLDQNKSHSQVDIVRKLEESNEPASEQNKTMANAAEGKEVERIWKIAGDIVWTKNLEMALNAKNYKAAQQCTTPIIKNFKQHMNEMEKYLVYTAWLGYVPCENGDIAFQNIRIVSLTNKPCTAPQASFLGIPIRWRHLHEVSSEAEETIHLEDIDVNINHSEKNKVDSGQLFRNHSNLTMVHVSSFKSTNFNTYEHKIDKQPCVALYCRVKGIIPLGENPFPKSLGILPTDVREGYCTLGAGGTLQPGEDIQCIDASKSGTIGGFFENQDGKKCFITAAHIFANTTQLHDDNATKEDRFGSGNIIVHQNLQRIGKVVRGLFSDADDSTETSIDAAIVEIDKTGPSVSYNFPETDHATLACTGYKSNHMPTLCSNSLLSETQVKENRRLQVMKYGAVTELTSGSLKIAKLDVVFHDLNLDTVDVSPDTEEEKKQPFRFCGQMGVHSCTEKSFFEIGDSGAFCFMLDEQDEFSVRPFGLAIGKLSSGTCIVTPLQEVLRKLNLNEEIALFDNHQQSLSDDYNETKSLKEMLENLLDRKFEQADQKREQSFERVHKRLEQADQHNKQIFEAVHKRLEQVEQKISIMQCEVKNIKEKVNKETM